MIFHLIQTILTNMFSFNFDKRRNNILKGVPNLLSWPETRKIEIHQSIFYLNSKYTRPVFYHKLNTSGLYLTHPTELIGLYMHGFIYAYLAYIFESLTL